MGDVDDKIDAAQKMVAALCNQDRRWIMSIPARPDYDPDLVIGEALGAAKKELDTLRARAEKAERCYADVVLSFDDAADQADEAKKKLSEAVAAIEIWKKEAAYFKNQASIILDRANKLEAALAKEET